MKLRLLILLAAAALAAAPAAGQTIKSLGYNTTNGQIVYSGTNALTFTNALQFSTNARAATRTNLGATTVGNAVFTATNADAARSAIGAGTVNEGGEPSFESVTANLITAESISESTGGLQAIDLLNFSLTFGTNYVLEWSATEVQLYKPLTFFGTNTASTTLTNLGLGATNAVTFSNITAGGNIYAKDSTGGAATNSTLARGIQWTNLGGSGIAAIYGSYPGTPQIYLAVGTTNALTDVATFRSTGMTVASNAVVGGTLAVTGNVTMSGVGNTAPSQTASSGSSLMTRDLSDDRYLGEMWNASRMVGYNTTNPSVTVFIGEPMVTYTNGQAAGPYMHQFIDAEKYAGKTVRVLAYCRVNSTNGGNVQGVGRIQYLTNTAGGPDSQYPLSLGGQAQGTIGVYTSANTDVFPVETSTNQYLIFTSNVGTIPTNAKMIIASFGFNRASTNTTFTNNLYMHAVQLVVENP